MSLLLPLYMYPWPGVWDPLYWAAGNNTSLNITVILNPCSGPCIDTLPDQFFLDEMPKLKSYPNIRTLGYVATNYTNRPIDDVLLEIRTYAYWPETLSEDSISIDGIFFDETPGQYDWKSYDYLSLLTSEVKSSPQLGEGVVVHNPGTIPYIDWNYLDLADITVVFEEAFSKFIHAPEFYKLKSLGDMYGLPKDRFAVMLHSIPDIPVELVAWMTESIKECVEWSFVSSVTEKGEYWHSFSELFEPFVDLYAR